VVAAAEAMAGRIDGLRRFTERGVQIADPLSTVIDPDVEIGAGTIILQGSTILAGSSIGPGCRIGPGALIERSQIGDRCEVLLSVVRDSRMEAGSNLGPYGHVRGDSRIGEDVHLGTSVEVNRSSIGRGSKAAHFSYIGDARIGENVNIGAGTVTCNYDGKEKHQTVIEDNAFIGSGTMLVAPVRLGRGSATGAGSVVTRDVPPGQLVTGVPARPLDDARG
jgi:bifunctional UDP-N-acetylglucosamine pyrophosphorylase/glucosamine-1-phosphate N-acetyltransferase